MGKNSDRRLLVITIFVLQLKTKYLSLQMEQKVHVYSGRRTNKYWMESFKVDYRSICFQIPQSSFLQILKIPCKFRPGCWLPLAAKIKETEKRVSSFVSFLWLHLFWLSKLGKYNLRCQFPRARTEYSGWQTGCPLQPSFQQANGRILPEALVPVRTSPGTQSSQHG